MDIKLFSLCNEESHTADTGKKYILDCVNNFSEEKIEFSHFTSQKRMLVSIAQSLLSAEIIVIAVQDVMYNTTKKLLCSALSVKMQENEFVSQHLKNKLNSGKMNINAYSNNIMFPCNCEILPTDKFINCGFAISSGSQHIIYMPIDAPKADEIVLGSLYDYLAEISDGEAFKHNLSYRQKAIITRTAEKLHRGNIKVALSPKNLEFFNPLKYPGKVKDVFSIATTIDDSDIQDEKEYCINSARLARESKKADCGVAISAVIEDDDSRFIYAVIALESETKIIKIYAENNESDEELNLICLDRLMLLLYNYDEPEGEEAEFNEDLEKDDRLKSFIGIAVSGVLLAASITGFILALILQ